MEGAHGPCRLRPNLVLEDERADRLAVPDHVEEGATRAIVCSGRLQAQLLEQPRTTDRDAAPADAAPDPASGDRLEAHDAAALDAALLGGTHDGAGQRMLGVRFH